MPEILRSASVLLFALIATACVPIYKSPPLTNKTAQLRFATHVDVGIMNISAFVHDSKQSFCEKNQSERQSIGHMNGIAIEHNRQTLSMPLGDIFSDEAKTEIVIEANDRFYYTIGFESDRICIASAGICTGSSRCIVRGSFIPSAGKMYEVAYDIRNSMCMTAVFQISTNTSGEYVREEELSALPYEASCLPSNKEK